MFDSNDNRPGLAAALEAARNGISVIPIRMDGTKAPMIAWAPYQERIADPLTIESWGTSTDAFAWVGGRVSERLICLDIEGVFWRENRTELFARLNAAGLLEAFAAWSLGCCNTTPSGGIHIWIRLMGNDPVPGNTKIAMSSASETWIETRGEGGYAIQAPTNGATHPSGRAWASYNGGCTSIEWVPEEIYFAVLDLLATFDEGEPDPEPPPRIPARIPRGGGWVDEALATYHDEHPLDAVLTGLGWTYIRTDKHGPLFRHPESKNRGWSGRINSSGRLHVFSTSTPLPAGRTTYDSLDVVLGYRLGRPPSRDERTGELRRYRSDPPATHRGARPADAEPSTGGGDDSAPIILNRPDAFWQARPYLDHIRTAALSWGISPDMAWEAIKWAVASTTPAGFLLPRAGTLDYIGVNVGRSGIGKSMAKNLALELMPTDALKLGKTLLAVPAGTGEGMTERYLRRVRDGEGGWRQQIAFDGIGYYADEGEFIHSLQARSGSTIRPILKSAWGGELTGQTNASAERARFLPPRAVRFGMLISITPGDAAKFLAADMVDGGLPQRINWSWGEYPAMPDLEGRPAWPGRLDIPVHALKYQLGQELTVEPSIQSKIESVRLAKTRGEGADDLLEGQAPLATLKVAAILALMDDRFHVSVEDWDLASQDWAATGKVRAHVGAMAHGVTQERQRQVGSARAIADEATYQYHLNKGVDELVRLLHNSDGPLQSKEIKSKLRHLRRRYGLDHNEVVDAAVVLGKVVRRDRHGVSLRGGH